MTEKQKLQKDRAYFKFVLTGLPKPINTFSLTAEESIMWNQIIQLRSDLLMIHDGCSREKGLNVPEHKCFFINCRGKAIHEISDTFLSNSNYWMCNKHFEEHING